MELAQDASVFINRMKLSLLEFCKERLVTIQVPISDVRKRRRSAERKRLANEWKRLGLERIASMDIAPPPPRGFIRAYHFVEAKHGRSDIIAQRLKVARFSDLNDPFELLGLNSHERLIRRAAKSHKKDQDSNFGLLCFSKNWNDPLLWSHYAEKHRGLCLGFDLRESKVEAVKYEDKRIRIELDLGQGDALRIPTDLQRLLRVTKARCWSYEQEFRVFIRLIEAKLEGKLHFWPFNDDLRLVEVIIGPESNESVSALERLAGPEVYVSKARLAWRSFTVVPWGTHLSSRLG
jgi:hypothetical protein